MFHYDNSFFRGINKALDIFYASLLWILFCLPVITIGASTQALYYTVHKQIKGNRSYVFRCFWNSFRDELIDSVKVTLLLEGLFAVLFYDQMVLKALFVNQPYSIYGFFYYIFYILMWFVLIWGIITFSYRARFQGGWKESVINGLKLFIIEFPWSLLMLGMVFAAVTLIRDMPFFAMVFPCLICMAYESILEKMFRKLMTRLELEEEIELEMERKR